MDRAKKGKHNSCLLICFILSFLGCVRACLEYVKQHQHLSLSFCSPFLDIAALSTFYCGHVSMVRNDAQFTWSDTVTMSLCTVVVQQSECSCVPDSSLPIFFCLLLGRMENMKFNSHNVEFLFTILLVSRCLNELVCWSLASELANLACSRHNLM